jgi:hypothetical protein
LLAERDQLAHLFAPRLAAPLRHPWVVRGHQSVFPRRLGRILPIAGWPAHLVDPLLRRVVRRNLRLL